MGLEVGKPSTYIWKRRKFGPFQRSGETWESVRGGASRSIYSIVGEGIVTKLITGGGGGK